MRYIIILLLFSTLLTFTIFSEEDPDLFWHLKVGEWMSGQHKILQENPFLGTAPSGGWSHWVNYQWIPQVMFYRIFKIGGINALIILKSLVWLAIFFFIFKIGYHKNTYLLNVLGVLMAIFVVQARICVRPEMFSYLFLSLYLFVLYKYSQRESKIVYLLPILQIFWVNMHVYYFLGPLLILLYCLGGTKNAGALRFRRLAFITLLTMLSCLINPNGLEGAVVPFRLLSSLKGGDNFGSYIAELQPILPRLFSEKTSILFFYKALILTAGLSFALNIKRANLGNLFGCIIFLLISIKWLRYINIFAIFAVVQIIINFKDFFAAWQNKINFKYKPKLKLVGELITVSGLGVVLLLSTNIFFSERILNIHQLGLGVSETAYPKKAVDFIQAAGLKGNIFNNFEAGGYIDWYLYPQSKAFIDGTIGIYGKDIWDDYIRALQLKIPLDALTEKYKINYFLLMHIFADSRPLIKKLYQDKNWKLIYLDEVSMVFIKDTQGNQQIITKNQVHLAEVIEPIKNKVNRRNVEYLVYMAEIASVLGELKQAESLYLKANGILPQNPELYHRLGVTYYEEGLFDQAIDAYKKALQLRPGYFGTHYGLGMCYVKSGDYSAAIQAFTQCLKFNPRYDIAHYNLAVAYTQIPAPRIDLAIKHLDKSIKFGFRPDPRFIEHLKKISR